MAAPASETAPRFDHVFLGLVMAASLAVIGMIYLGEVHRKLAELGYPARSFGTRYFAVIALGSAVGLTEILLRYRDEPTLAVLSFAGAAFILLNGAFAALALFLIEFYGTLPPEATPKGPDGRPIQISDAVSRVLLAGLGAMVVLRGKVLTVPVGQDGKAEIGFAPLADAVLAAVNRAIDRKRARQRLALVAPMAREMAATGFAALAPHLRTSLQSLQTLELERQAKVLSNIEKLEKDKTAGDVEKLEALGYDLVNNFGDAGFREVFGEARRSAEAAAKLRQAMPAAASGGSGATPPGAAAATPPGADDPGDSIRG